MIDFFVNWLSLRGHYCWVGCWFCSSSGGSQSGSRWVTNIANIKHCQQKSRSVFRAENAINLFCHMTSGEIHQWFITGSRKKSWGCIKAQCIKCDALVKNEPGHLEPSALSSSFLVDWLNINLWDHGIFLINHRWHKLNWTWGRHTEKDHTATLTSTWRDVDVRYVQRLLFD